MIPMSPRCLQAVFILVAALPAGCGGPTEDGASGFETSSEAVAASAAPEVSFPITPVLDDSGVALGSVALAPGCAPEASTMVLRGLALLHNMTHLEAETAFRTATELDSSCALGYWGQAASFVHPVWPDVPPEEQFAKGWSLLQRARQVGLSSRQEEGWVEALEAYYRDGLERSEPQRLSDYAAAWTRVSEADASDLEARLFMALALVATAPGSDMTFANQIRAGEMAEAVLDVVPDHPGALHYIIHAYDLPGLARRALPAAQIYGDVSPENAHALHMTSHIFTRLGLWEESIAFNRRSAAAALAHPVGGATSHHHLHALDYLAYAHLQQGDDKEAQAVVEHLEALDGPIVDNAVTAYAFAAIPVRVALERRDWKRAASLPARWPAELTWDRYPHLEAIVEFAHALGAAQVGDLAAARAAVEKLSELQEAAAALPDRYDWGVQVEIQRVSADAWLARAEGRPRDALRLMRRAAELESTAQKHPVTPGEALPASELLGDMLLDMGRPLEARTAYQDALRRAPNRLNSLFGSGRAAELAGDARAAQEDYTDLVSLVEGEGSLPQIAHAKAYLGID